MVLAVVAADVHEVAANNGSPTQAPQVDVLAARRNFSAGSRSPPGARGRSPASATSWAPPRGSSGATDDTEPRAALTARPRRARISPGYWPRTAFTSAVRRRAWM